MIQETIWTAESGSAFVYSWEKLSSKGKKHLLELLEKRFPLNDYFLQIQYKEAAFRAQKRNGEKLKSEKLVFPNVIPQKAVQEDSEVVRGILRRSAILITAGGDGERLKTSLLQSGTFTEDQLEQYTKATIPIDEAKKTTTLSYNLAYFKKLLAKFGLDQPVFIGVGPTESQNEALIRAYIQKQDQAMRKNLFVLPQGERLHLDDSNKIHWKSEKEDIDRPLLVTHPDETGGALVALRKNQSPEMTWLQWLEKRGIERILLVQGTSVFHPQLPLAMLAASEQCDALGVGIPNIRLEDQKHLGVFVGLHNGQSTQHMVVEANQKTDTITSFYDSVQKQTFPGNTGFYLFKLNLLSENLPHYASSPKLISGTTLKAPKIGFAATGYIEKAKDCRILLVEPEQYVTLKEASDIQSAGKKAGVFVQV